MVLETLVAAVGLGILAQALAARLKLPAILPLLLLGITAGPSVLGLFHPEALGPTLEALVHLGVAVILFEGGLSLDSSSLRKVRGALLNLLTLGVALTGILATILVHVVIGLPWQTAALFGAIVTVTGPTVISPLLRHTIAPRPVKTLLLSEGLIIDAIGALLAYLVLRWIELQGMPMDKLAMQVIQVTLVGIILGYVGGKVGEFLARSRTFDGELSNLIILALLMVVYYAAEAQAHQAGILAAVVMGFTLSNSELPDLVHLKRFKGQLTVLLISVLFILLSGQLDLEEIYKLGWGGLVVAAGLIFVIRPVSVFLSVWPHQLAWRERTFLALTAPRGIVAAAVASLAARQLNAAGISGGSLLEGLVYLSILATGAWATLMSLVLPSALGYTYDPARRRAIVVGANAFSGLFADLLKRTGRTTVVVDALSWRLDGFRERGFGTQRGDAREAATYEDAGVESDSIVVATTTNDELNLLVAEVVHHEFGVEHPVVAMQSAPEDLGSRSRAWIDQLSGRDVAIPTWIERLDRGQAELLEIPLSSPEVLDRATDLLDDTGTDAALLAAWKGREISLRVRPEDLDGMERISVLLWIKSPALERWRKLVVAAEPAPEAAEERDGGDEAAAKNAAGSKITSPLGAEKI